MKVEVFGSGPRALLLLHGGGVAGWMWRPMMQHLGPEFTVLVPGFPGHGAGAADSYRSHRETVEALEALLERHAPQGAVVVGFSLGAQLALLLGAARPELVERMVVVSAQAKAAPLTRATLALLAVAAPLARRPWFARLQAKELLVPPALLNEYIATSAGISRATLLAAVGENLRFTPPEVLRRFTKPALVMVGGKERRLMLDSARIIHTILPAGELEIVDGCGHGIPLQRPEWFANRLRSWVLRGGDETVHQAGTDQEPFALGGFD